jgi:16S rRNA (adenine1518-N6/adenine1519-N6)-dimethyltransferase
MSGLASKIAIALPALILLPPPLLPGALTEPVMVYKKKSLGQHFLRDSGAAQAVAEALEPLPEGGRCLEIGPGQGALTRWLLLRPGLDLWVCERDDRFAASLPTRFAALSGRVLHRDVLELVPAELPPAPLVLVGNFPYNISSQIVFWMLDKRERFPKMVGMFQREMALRICAGPGSRDYGIISVLVAAWYRAEYLFELPPEAFDPPPKVHSAVIRLERREREPMPDESRFRLLVRTAFQQRRKKLRNALAALYPPGALSHPGFDRRAEELPLEEYEAMARSWPGLPPELTPEPAPDSGEDSAPASEK